MSTLSHTHDLTEPLDPGLAPQWIGGKGANLLRLSGCGLRTPAGVAVTVRAFREHLEVSGVSGRVAELARDLSGGEVPEDALAEIRARILAAEVSEVLLGEVRRRCETWPDSRLIVRSSATVEDSARHSFAGIFESLPIAGLAGLGPAMKRVWASVFAPRAVAYYQLSGLNEFPAMAVIVQPFVEAARSGVMFTRFVAPDGEERLLAEHVEGDCEKLVTGAANPERIWLPRWPAAGDPAVADEVTAPLAGRFALALADAGRRLEDLFGAPQDVEWCVQGDDLYILQARPVTTGQEAGRRAGAADARVLLSGVPASAGRAGGPAHLVFNIDDADALARGQVLVTTMTNPDMVSAMRKSSAVVTDVGGMICHAAIVSRELGIPCVVGTETATALVEEADELTVDGSAGLVYAGLLAEVEAPAARGALGWADLWEDWRRHRQPQATPLVSTLAAVEHAPWPLEAWALVPYMDLILDEDLQAIALSSLATAERRGRFRRLLERTGAAARSSGARRVRLVPLFLDPFAGELEEEARRVGGLEVLPGGVLPPDLVPLGAVRLAAARVPEVEAGGEGGRPEGVFGRAPAVRMAAMPDPARRGAFQVLLPALAAAHAGRDPGLDRPHEWLDLRPEVAITPMLKSVVFAGMETIPAALGFRDLQPVYVKWIRCRFHFRRDTFGAVWMRLVEASWDAEFMTDLLARTRASYDRLEAAAAAFPRADSEWRAASAAQCTAWLLPWWRAFVDFFSLSFFIQAQGDDCMYPYAGEVVAENLARLARAGGEERTGPGVAELTAPTSPVLTAEYLADLARLRAALLAAGCADLGAAMAAVSGDGDAEARAVYEEHWRKWHWMRERDPYYEPYDRPQAILEKALGVGEARPPDYAANRSRALLALSLHFDLALGRGDPARLVHAVGFGHGLERDRENHHVVWLKASYPFRKLCLEWERRLREVSPLEAGDVFFLEIPEALAAVESLPRPLDEATLRRLRNRRRAYHQELRLKRGEAGGEKPEEEDDYY